MNICMYVGPGGDNGSNNAELQTVISSLEEEFEALNGQYRRLLASSNHYLPNTNAYPNLPSDGDGNSSSMLVCMYVFFSF